VFLGGGNGASQNADSKGRWTYRSGEERQGRASVQDAEALGRDVGRTGEDERVDCDGIERVHSLARSLVREHEHRRSGGLPRHCDGHHASKGKEAMRGKIVEVLLLHEFSPIERHREHFSVTKRFSSLQREGPHCGSSPGVETFFSWMAVKKNGLYGAKFATESCVGLLVLNTDVIAGYARPSRPDATSDAKNPAMLGMPNF
jgi:hypothetical protein